MILPRSHLAGLIAGTMVLLVGSGCVSQSAREHVSPDYRNCLGASVSDAMQRLGLNAKDMEIGDEPPGVARCFTARVNGGNELTLYIARQDPKVCGQFDPKRGWKIEEFADATVVGIRYKGEMNIGEIPVGFQSP